MKKIYITVLIVFGLLFVLLPAKLNAFTKILDSTISEDTHWTKQGSPYLIIKDLLISPVATLIIDPGVIIKSNNAYVEVYGTVIASGTPEEKISITSYSDDALGGDSNNDGTVPHEANMYDARGWYFYESSGSSILNNVDIRYSSDGMYFDSTNASINGISVKNSRFGITLNQSTLHATNINAEKSGTVFSLYNQSNASISSSTASESFGMFLYAENSTFSLNNLSVLDTKNLDAINIKNSTGTISAISLTSGDHNGINSIKSNLQINNCTISNFKSAGIRATSGSASVSSTTFSHNAFGLYYQNTSAPVVSEITIKIMNLLAFLFFPKVYSQTLPVQISESEFIENSNYGIFNASTTLLSAEHNYWGNDTGPLHPTKNQNGRGDRVSDNVNFTPWIDRLLQYSSCCSSVMFFPGVEASRLYKLSAYGEDKLWEPNINKDIQDLFLTEKGESVQSGIYPSDIIKRISVFGVNQSPIYESFAYAMDGLVQQKRINGWQAYPYDWRLNPADLWKGISLKEKTVLIEDEIKSLASSSKTGKVTLIGHSNGALLAKYISKKLQDAGNSELIDKLILIAAPEFGAMQAVSALLHGDDQSVGAGILMSHSLARTFSENMPSAYNLLPSNNYQVNTTEPFIRFDASINKINNFIETYGSSIKTQDSLRDFLFAKDQRKKPISTDIGRPNNLNNYLLNTSVDFHSTIDSFVPTSSIKTTYFFGFGKSTTNGIDYFAHNSCGINIFPCNLAATLDHKNRKTTEGDGTVIAENNVGIASSSTYFLDLSQLNKDTSKNYAHASILEAPSLIESIKNILENDIPYKDKYITSALIHSRQSKKIELSVHSPISIGVTNSDGLYTGLIYNPDSDIQYISQEIPNSTYEEVGEGKYITIDNAEDIGPLIIVMKGLGTGVFTYEQIISSETSSSSLVFSNIPVTASTTAKIILLPDATTSAMMIDENGDGVTDKTVQPTNQEISSDTQDNVTSAKSETASQFPVSASQYGSTLNYLIRTYIDPITHLIKTYFCVPIINALKSI